MIAHVERMVNTAQLKWHRVYKFKAKVDMQIEIGSYLIKTAETPEELMECFKLRHEVFYQEFIGQQKSGLDFDRFDYFFDHLIIIHKPSRKIIGTYRLSSSSNTVESYTALEFDISALRSLKAPLLELGRACINKEFRKGSIISLLWRGIAEYMNLTNTNILYGCTSIKENQSRSAALIYKYLDEEGYVSKENHCLPTKSFTPPSISTWFRIFNEPLSPDLKIEAENMLPSLLKSYLKMGAKVASWPAYDADFDCLDLLTVLNKSNLAQSVAEKFQVVR